MIISLLPLLRVGECGNVKLVFESQCRSYIIFGGALERTTYLICDRSWTDEACVFDMIDRMIGMEQE